MGQQGGCSWDGSWGSNNVKYWHGKKYFESAVSKYVTLMEKATEMETKITGALRMPGAIYTANSISE